MFKSIFLKYLDNIFGSLWVALHHKAAFPVVFMFFVAGIVAVGTVDIPFKGKTLLEWRVHSELENWRLHANTTEIFTVRDDRDRLKDECASIERYLRELRVSKYTIKGSTMSDLDKAKELDEIIYHKGKAEKKLVAAEQRLQATSHLYETLIATR
jgi:hypothetical protein